MELTGSRILGFDVVIVGSDYRGTGITKILSVLFVELPLYMPFLTGNSGWKVLKTTLGRTKADFVFCQIHGHVDLNVRNRMRP